MILRIVRGRIAVNRVEAWAAGLGAAAALGASSDRRARTRPGLLRTHVGVRPLTADECEVVLVTCWETVDAAIATDEGAGSGADSPDRAAADARPDDVAYFEVDESTIRRSEAAADILRLSFGRVARGLDVDIQQELRQRMHLLEPDMSEGYVGRRILGNDVEIAFISAWEREPEGRALDASVWPDISVSYDAFEVATFRAVTGEAAVR